MLSIVMGNQSDGKSVLLVIVLDKNNLARLQKADPATLPLHTVPLPAGLDTKNLEVMICYEEDVEEVLKLQANPDGRVLLAHLCRGWTTQGDDGMAPMRPGRPQ